VQVDQGRAPGDLSEGVGHRDGGGLLQRQHIAEIIGEFLQESFLGRTWITEDGRQSQRSQQIVGHTSDGGFLGHAFHCLSGRLAGHRTGHTNPFRLFVPRSR